MLKAFKYRLYPTAEQAVIIDQTISACRLVYNLGLEIRSYAWKSAQRNVNWIELAAGIPELRKAHEWIAGVNSQVLYGALRNLESAYVGFFAGGGYPKFKKKRHGGSFCCQNNLRRVNWGNSTISIPKIYGIPFVASKRFSGEIRSITVRKTGSGKYFASVLVKTEDAMPSKREVQEKSAIGIDLGIKSFAVMSDGRSFASNQYLKNSLQRLRCLQQRAARKKNGSRNQGRIYQSIALLHDKITNQRADYIHKITTALVRDNQADTFVIENLNVAGMVRNGKLSRSISDASFGLFRRILEYKCEWYGKNIIVIDRFAPSSKRCSNCGAINETLTLSDREWTCPCGSVHDRDLNAAINIKHFGISHPKASGKSLRSRGKYAGQGSKKQRRLKG